VLCSPYWHDMFKAINEARTRYKSPNYEKARTMLIEREKEKVQRALTRFTNECGWIVGYPLYQVGGQMLETNIR